MGKEDKSKNTSRKKFLKQGLGLAVSAVAGSSLLANSDKKEDVASGNTVKVLTTDGKVVEVDDSKLSNDHAHCKPAVGDKAREGIPYKKFVMVFDLSACKNARACVEQCQHAHHLPPDKEWLKVYKMQESKNTAPYWFPKTCFHCDNAPCVSVCPTSASFKRSDGIVLIDSETCIGCKYCMVACPYDARSYNWKKDERKEDLESMEYSPESSLPIKSGTVGKCDFCPDLLAHGKLPHCVTACPMGVIYFGDVNEDTVTNGEKTVRFSELMRDKSGYRYMEYLGTEPNVYYLPSVDRSFPFSEENDEEGT